MYRSGLILFAVVITCIQVQAQPINIVPFPSKVEQGNGYCSVDSNTVIWFEWGTEQWKESLEPLQTKLDVAAGFRIKTVSQRPLHHFIVVNRLSDSFPSGAYDLNVQKDKMFISARDEQGFFYAVQTILQLLPGDIESKKRVKGTKWQIPVIAIKDQPAFAYRGLMIDVARHFLPLEFLYKMVDQMSVFKMNNLHLHLTDDQGWRLEIRKYPKLTSVGSRREGTLIGRYPGMGNDNQPHAGYYTQDEMKELVKYAAKKHIRIIPEIDLPGHSSAAIAAYPALSCFPDESTVLNASMSSESALKKAAVPGGKVVQETWGVFEDVLCPSEYTFTFLNDVLNEVMDVFPSPYIHIGGDECPKESWKRSADAQEFIKSKELHGEEGLQSYIIRALERYVQARGRRIIGWDEILEGGLAPDATVMSWRGTGGGIQAAQKGHEVIMSPVDVYYLNLYQSEDPADSIAWGGLTPLKKTYDFNPLPAELHPAQHKHIKGVQANLWTEYIKTPALAEFMLFPRLLAVAETGWSSSKPGFNDFAKRMQSQLNRLEISGINTSSHLFELGLIAGINERKTELSLKLTGTSDKQQLFYSINGGLKKKYQGPVNVTGKGTITATANVGGRVTDSKSFQYAVTASTGKSLNFLVPPDPAYNRGGMHAWTNGIFGSDTRYTDAEWLGWNGKNFEGIIGFQQSISFHSIRTRFFHAPGSWVYMPQSVQLFVSDDGINFRLAVEKKVEAGNESGPQKFQFDFPGITARFIKLIAVNHGMISNGNPGAGFPAWLFVDEVVVE